MALVVRLPGAGALAVEHIVRTDVHHLDIQLFADLGDISRPVRVYPAAQLHIILRRVHRRISGAVDHRVHMGLRDHALAGFLIGDIHLLHIDAHGCQPPFFHLGNHVMAQLAFYSRNQNPHIPPPVFFLTPRPFYLFFRRSPYIFSK